MRRTVWGPDGRVYFSDLVANRVGVLTLQPSAALHGRPDDGRIGS